MAPATPCDLLIEDVLVLTLDADERVIAEGAVAVVGDRVTAVGTVAEIRANWAPQRVVSGRGGILMPGLVNTHNHTPLMIVRGMVEDRGFAPAYLAGVPQGDALSHDEALALSRLGVYEAVAAGATTIVDYYRHPQALAEAAAEIGVRAVICGRIMDISSTGLADGRHRHDPAVGDAMLAENLELIDAWNGKAEGRIRCDLAPHAPDTCAPDLLARVAAEADRRQCRVHTHLCQSTHEVDYVRQRDGHGPVETLAAAGLLHDRLLAAHCIHMSKADITRAGTAGIAVAHSPVGNLASGRAAPILDLAVAGARITLCTDTKSGDLFEAMRAAVASARIRGADYEPKARVVLRWATAEGAAALGFEDEIAVIAPGRKADLILLDRRHPNLTPVIDGVGIVVHSGRGSNVDTVVVDGRILIHGGRPVAFDGDAIVADAQAVAERLWQRHGTQPIGRHL
jgi:5-methylthioadenosine/S-adenosylhomocysteine deaminase